jgi:hypothetical protein
MTAALRHFFAAERWQQSIDRFPLSGLALVDRVNALAPAVVVDVGCGFNPFKGKIRNLPTSSAICRTRRSRPGRSTSRSRWGA